MNGNNRGGVQSTVQINVNELDVMTCPDPNCRNHLLIPLIALRMISALQSPNGQEQMLHTQDSFYCIQCGSTIHVSALTRHSAKSQIAHMAAQAGIVDGTADA